MNLPSKICERCGRAFRWRRQWRTTWDDVKFCGAACEMTEFGETDAALEHAIVDLLERTESIGLPDAARAVAPNEWRSWVDRARMAARRLVASGEVEVFQGDRVVDATTVKGPFRIRRS